MKIQVFSDSHGGQPVMINAVNKEKPDVIIHLGDFISDFKALSEQFPRIEAYGVKGNCDHRLTSYGRERLMITFEGLKLLLVHGHQYDVKLGLERLYFAALEAEADIALFGHTHISYLEKVKGITFMNPGSIGRGLTPSYGIINISGGEIKAEILRAQKQPNY